MAGADYQAHLHELAAPFSGAVLLASYELRELVISESVRVGA
jgi:hypothetical protein